MAKTSEARSVPCPRCGYETGASGPGACPECGQHISPAEAVHIAVRMELRHVRKDKLWAAGRRVVRAWPVLLLIAVIGAPVALPLLGVASWSELNCRHEEIDLMTGKWRRTRHLWFVRISEVVDETWISRTLKLPDPPSGPRWRRVNTFAPGIHHSPNYVFHSAFSQARDLEIITRLARFTPAAQRRLAETVLDLWETEGRTWAAAEYIWRVNEVATEAAHAGRVVGAEDLPER